MIDFYKHSFLSILGKNAGTMSEIQYPREIVDKYSEYLKSVKEMKQKIEENGPNNNTEIYL